MEKKINLSEVLWLPDDKLKIINNNNILNKNVYLLNSMNTALELKRELVNWKINQKILYRLLQRNKDMKNMRD